MDGVQPKLSGRFNHVKKLNKDEYQLQRFSSAPIQTTVLNSSRILNPFKIRLELSTEKRKQRVGQGKEPHEWLQ